MKSKKEIEQLLNSTRSVGRSFFPRNGVYLQIMNNGQFSLLQSEEIKNQLLDLYDRKYKLYAHVDAVIEQKNQFSVKEVVEGKLSIFPPRMKLEPYEKFDLQVLKKNYDE